MATPDDRIPKTRTITLTDAQPVRIRDDQWPIIAQVTQLDDEGTEEGASSWLKVRQHADGRVIVYGGRDVALRGGDPAPPPWASSVVYRAAINGKQVDARAGEVLMAGENIAYAIRRIAEEIRVPDKCARDCIAALPPVEI